MAKITFETTVNYAVKHIWPSGSTSTLSYHDNAKDAQTEARFRHAKEPNNKFSVCKITDEEIYTIA